MSKIIVLGAGMVGSAMAIDLSFQHQVYLADINRESLERAKTKCPALLTEQIDVCDISKLKQSISSFDLIICAVPGFLGYNTVKAVIESGKNIVDISFFPENALELDSLAKEKGVTAFVDCGVAPGVHNLILGYYNEKLKISNFECYVGGLPKVRKWPFFYKAPFSPIDVIEEYTRPARFVENGVIVTRDALSDCEFLDFENVGTLEAFNSDGLRSILHTMSHIKNMKEKTLRYPGHVEYVRVLKESGFFSKKKINVKGVEVSPIDVSCTVLFKDWKLGETEEEITVMRVILKGENKLGESEEIIYNLYDEFNHETQTSSMARTTGYTATGVANMFLKGHFQNKGVFPPELIGKNESCFNFIMEYLKERNINYVKSSSISQQTNTANHKT